MPRKFVKMKQDFLSYQKGVVYFFDDPPIQGPNPADRIVRRGFGELVADPTASAPEPVEEEEVIEAEPEPEAVALGDAADGVDREALNELAKELGVPNYWAMKAETLAKAIAEREEEAEEAE
jgi:hypothetical protein